jgi:hypothetical protein
MRLHCFALRPVFLIRKIALVAILLTLGVNVSAQPFDVRDFRDTAGWNYVNIPRTAQVLEMTENAHLRPTRAALWRRDRIAIAGAWTATLTFQILDTGGKADPSGRGGADGLAFVIQREGSTAIGTAGYGLGYSGIAGGLAVEVDTWDDSDEPVWGGTTEDRADHIAVHSNGRDMLSAVPQYSELHASAVVGDVSDGLPHTLVVRYAPGMLRVFLDDCTRPVLSVAVWLDTWLADSAFVGITAATQSAWQRHRLWSFCMTTTGAGCGCERTGCDTVYVERVRDSVVYRDRVRDSIVYVPRDTGSHRVDTLWRDRIIVRDSIVPKPYPVPVPYPVYITRDSIVYRVRDSIVYIDVPRDTGSHRVDTMTVTITRDTCTGVIRIDSTVCGYVNRAFILEDSVALSIAPNPARDAVTIMVTSPGPWSLVVTDLSGVDVTRIEGQGRARVVADVSQLPSGIYDVALWSGEVRRASRFVVRR